MNFFLFFVKKKKSNFSWVISMFKNHRGPHEAQTNKAHNKESPKRKSSCKSIFSVITETITVR